MMVDENVSVRMIDMLTIDDNSKSANYCNSNPRQRLVVASTVPNNLLKWGPATSASTSLIQV